MLKVITLSLSKLLFGMLPACALILVISLPVFAGKGECPDTTPNGTPCLTIEKTAAESSVRPGDLIHYTIKPNLKRTNKATDVVIIDPIPSATSFVSVTGGGVYDPNSTPPAVTWTFPEFNQGGNPSFELIVQVDNPTAATEVENTITIDGKDRDGNPVDGDTGSVTVPIGEAPVIELTKAANAENFAPGEQVVYTIAYQNVGNLEAINAVLSDSLPPSTNYVSSTLGGVYDSGTRIVTWPADNLAVGSGGELFLTLQIDPASPNGEIISNTAVMSGDNFTAVSATSTITVQSAPILTLSKSAGSEVTGPNEQLDYLLEFSNEGNAAATVVTLEDVVPQDTTFVSASGGGQFDGTKVVWNLNDLQAGDDGSVTMTVRVRGSISPADDIAIANTAILDSSNAPPVESSVTVPVILQAILEISKTANADFVYAGANVYYTIHYENIGTTPADNVILSDRIPAGTTFVSATGGGSLVGDEVIWTDPGLVPGAVGQVQLVLKLDLALVDNLSIINTASIASDSTIPVAASAIITVKKSPSLKIVKTANVEFVQPGSLITYTLEYTNRGNEDATTVTIEDLLPQHTIFVSASGGGSFSSGKVNWAFPRLGIGQTGSVTMTVQVGAVNNGDLIRNDVTLDSINAPAVSAFNEILVQQAAILTLKKIASFRFVAPGQEITFTLPYKNTGNAAANNVVIEDYLPSLTTFVTASGGGTYDPVKNKVVWIDPVLDVGAFGQVQLTLRVDGAAVNDTVITNSATIVSDNTSPITAFESFIVKVSPDLKLFKVANVTSTQQGDQITYTLKFANIGNATATVTILEDLIPNNTRFVSASGGGVLVDNKAVWNLGDLAILANGSVSMTVVVDNVVADGTIINNVATLDSSNTFAVSADNQVTVDLLPSLSLSKTASGEFVEAGQKVTFELAYENTGNAAATNILLTDAVPGGMSFVSATGGGVENNGTVSWTDSSLDVGATGRVQLTLKVNESVADNEVIVNSATITSNEIPPVSAEASLTVKRTPVLGLKNTASVKLVAPGDEITFTLDLLNVGNATAITIILEDAIPAGTTFVSATGGGTLNNGFVTWTGPELPIGVPASFALTVRVDDTVAAGAVINNTATADATNSYAVTRSSHVVVQRMPILGLTKTANADFVETGAQTTFTMEFENTGTAEAVNLVLEDEIPRGTTFISALPNGIHDPRTNKVTWNIPALQVNEKSMATLTVVVDTNLADSTVINNSATLNSANTQPITASDSVIVRRSPVLSISKTSNVDFIGPGEQLTYVINYTNIGNADATNIIIEDPIPADTSYVSNTGNGTFNQGRVTWNLASLTVGELGTVTMTVMVDPAAKEDVKSVRDGTIIRNTVTMDSPGTYAVAAEDEVLVKFLPALSISKTADSTEAIPGDTITYTLSVENTGNVTATNLVLQDTLPANTTFVSASDGGSEANGIVTWTLTSLAPGESGDQAVIVRINTPLDSGTTICNSSSLYSEQTLPVTAEHTLNVVSSALLSVVKTADKTLVSPGDLITYTLTVSNTGNANAINGILQDLIPANTSFVSASNGGTESGGIVSWNLPSILVGPAQPFYLTVQLPLALDNNTLIYNIASLASDMTAPVGADHRLYVQSAAKLIVVKSADKPLVLPDGQLIYTLTYNNIGDAKATNALLTDQLPDNTSFVSAGDGGTETGGVISWGLGTLNAGDGGTVNFTVQIDNPLDFNTKIYNIASINAEGTAPSVGDTTTYVLSLPRLTLEKTADNPVVDAGQRIVYTLNYANTGTANATGVTLTDVIPANTQFISASDGGSELNGEVTWPINSINTNESGGVTLIVEVDAPLDNGTLLTNTALLNCTQTLPRIASSKVVVQSSDVPIPINNPIGLGILILLLSLLTGYWQYREQ